MPMPYTEVMLQFPAALLPLQLPVMLLGNSSHGSSAWISGSLEFLAADFGLTQLQLLFLLLSCSAFQVCENKQTLIKSIQFQKINAYLFKSIVLQCL